MFNSAHFLPATSLSAADYLAAAENGSNLDYYQYLQQISDNQPDIERLTLRPVISYWAQGGLQRQPEINHSFLLLAPRLLGTQDPDQSPAALSVQAQISLPLIVAGIAKLWAQCQQALQISAPVIDYPQDLNQPGEVFRALRVIANRYQRQQDYRRRQMIAIAADRRRESEILQLLYSTGWGPLLTDSLANVIRYTSPDMDTPVVPALELTSAWLGAKIARGATIAAIEDLLWTPLHQLLVEQLAVISHAVANNLQRYPDGLRDADD